MGHKMYANTMTAQKRTIMSQDFFILQVTVNMVFFLKREHHIHYGKTK